MSESLNDLLERAYVEQTSAVRNALEVLATASESTVEAEVERLSTELKRMEFKRGVLKTELDRRSKTS